MAEGEVGECVGWKARGELLTGNGGAWLVLGWGWRDFLVWWALWISASDGGRVSGESDTRRDELET